MTQAGLIAGDLRLTDSAVDGVHRFRIPDTASSHPLPDIPAVFLMPGDVYFAKRPTCVSTVLGSCVSITMHVPFIGAGAICHALLPEGEDSDRFRCVDSSIMHMLDIFDGQGIRRSLIEAKIFGGSEILGFGSMSVGRKNVAAAERILYDQGVEVLAADVGGPQGRKLYFYTHTGDVFRRMLPGGSVHAEDGRQTRIDLSKEFLYAASGVENVFSTASSPMTS